MPITINGTGSIDGLTPGGLPDGSVTTADLAAGAATQAKRSEDLTLGTALAYNWNGLTTNTVLDFTGIPSWVKRVTVMFSGVSTSGASSLLVRLGSTTFQTTGYVSTGITVNGINATAGTSDTSGFVIAPGGAPAAVSAHMIITNVSGNIWACSHTGKILTTNTIFGGGDVTLSGTFDRVRITTVNGTDVFDAGTVNILFE